MGLKLGFRGPALVVLNRNAPAAPIMTSREGKRSGEDADHDCLAEKREREDRERSLYRPDNGKQARALARAKEFVESIMTATIDPISDNGMGVVRKIVNLETGKTINLVLRNITEPFWQACINVVDTPRYRVAAVGTPGFVSQLPRNQTIGELNGS